MSDQKKLSYFVDVVTDDKSKVKYLANIAQIVSPIVSVLGILSAIIFSIYGYNKIEDIESRKATPVGAINSQIVYQADNNVTFRIEIENKNNSVFFVDDYKVIMFYDNTAHIINDERPFSDVFLNATIYIDGEEFSINKFISSNGLIRSVKVSRTWDLNAAYAPLKKIYNILF